MKKNENKMQILEEKTKRIEELKASNIIIKASSICSFALSASIFGIFLKHECQPTIQIMSAFIVATSLAGIAYSNEIDIDNNKSAEELDQELEETEKEICKDEETLAKVKRMRNRIND